MPNKSIQQADYENLLARLLAETDPKRRRELTLKLEFAKKLAERTKGSQPE
jgi:DnaJ-domain-containing protein 1